MFLICHICLQILSHHLEVFLYKNSLSPVCWSLHISPKDHTNEQCTASYHLFFEGWSFSLDAQKWRTQEKVVGLKNIYSIWTVRESLSLRNSKKSSKDLTEVQYRYINIEDGRIFWPPIGLGTAILKRRVKHFLFPSYGKQHYDITDWFWIFTINVIQKICHELIDDFPLLSKLTDFRKITVKHMDNVE